MEAAQTPVEEVFERMAEHAPARTLPFLLAVENLRGMWKDARQRTKDSHRFMGKAAGADDVTQDDDVSDDMGDIYVMGDTTVTPGTKMSFGKNAISVEQEKETEPPPKEKNGSGILPMALVGLGMLGGGAGIGYIVADMMKPDSPPAVHDHTDTDTITEIWYPTE